MVCFLRFHGVFQLPVFGSLLSMLSSRTLFFVASPVLILPLLASILSRGEVKNSPAEPSLPEALESEEIQVLVDSVKVRLGISAGVTVKIHPHVEQLVSIQPIDELKQTFLLLFDQAFLGHLAPDELEAVVAHELGHLLIFTEHPYLHTEPLANLHALKIVSRASLGSAYTKVWEHTGRKGSISDFLGP